MERKRAGIEAWYTTKIVETTQNFTDLRTVTGYYLKPYPLPIHNKKTMTRAPNIRNQAPRVICVKNLSILTYGNQCGSTKGLVYKPGKHLSLPPPLLFIPSLLICVQRIYKCHVDINLPSSCKNTIYRQNNSLKFQRAPWV